MFYVRIIYMQGSTSKKYGNKAGMKTTQNFKIMAETETRQLLNMYAHVHIHTQSTSVVYGIDTVKCVLQLMLSRYLVILFHHAFAVVSTLGQFLNSTFYILTPICTQKYFNVSFYPQLMQSVLTCVGVRTTCVQVMKKFLRKTG